MNGKPFQGARRRVDPALLDIFYPPSPPDIWVDENGEPWVDENGEPWTT